MKTLKRRKYGRLDVWMYENNNYERQEDGSKVVSIPRSFGFTLVELVIVIAIVIVLSVVSVPIYRSYVDKAKITEAYALVGTIISAQKAYYAENGNFFYNDNVWMTAFVPQLGIDARGNKYFTLFSANHPIYNNNTVINTAFWIGVFMPEDLKDLTNGKNWLASVYNINGGNTFYYID